MSKYAISCAVAVVCVVGFILSSCSSGSHSTSSAAPASVNVAVSDPTTCSGPQGPFSHIYLTITDVQINSSASAGDSDPGWVDLTPNLQQNPQQVDMLGQANNQCFLAMLGSAVEIQPGSYQQIRIILASDSTTFGGNLCGSSANCVVLSNDPTHTSQPLLLSSQAKTGLKIPSGQIAGGRFTIAAGETKDLDIDFDACASIVTEGNGRFRLKPVLHAGEVSLTSSSINGKIVDIMTGLPIVGGNTVVALEQKDSSGVDRVIMETVTDSNGAFVFCPVATGIYDVVVSAVSGAQVAYGATVITGVQPGNALGTVPLFVQGANTTLASITGQLTTSTGSAATSADITLSALQPISENSTTVLVTIPLAAQSSTTVSVATAASATCPTTTNCVSYTLSVPAANPSVGVFSTSGAQQPWAPASGPVGYTLDAMASLNGSADCTPSEIQTSSTASNASLTVAAGTNVTAATLAFTGCQ